MWSRCRINLRGGVQLRAAHLRRGRHGVMPRCPHPHPHPDSNPRKRKAWLAFISVNLSDTPVSECLLTFNCPCQPRHCFSATISSQGDKLQCRREGEVYQIHPVIILRSWTTKCWQAVTWKCHFSPTVEFIFFLFFFINTPQIRRLITVTLRCWNTWTYSCAILSF